MASRQLKGKRAPKRSGLSAAWAKSEQPSTDAAASIPAAGVIDSTFDGANRQPAAGRLFVFVVHVGAGVAHGANNSVQRNKVLAVATQGHLRSVDGFHRSDGVALDARHLNQSAHRITGQAEVVFQADFRRVAQLLRVAPRMSARPAAAMAHAEPTSP